MSANQSPEQSQITQLWPVTILSRTMPDQANVNSGLMRLFETYQKAHPSGQKGAFYASPDDFAEDSKDPAYLALQQLIMDSVFEVAAKVNGPYWRGAKALNVALSGVWFQCSNNYAFHETHVHGNCSWSGVYYVQAGDCSKKAGDIGDNGQPNGITRFYGPHMEYMAGGHGDMGNLYLQYHSFDEFPADGKLVVFPSHLKHMVFPYNGQTDRVIVSFHAQVFGEGAMKYGYSGN
ncbi:putative 2OG-Fe(II) oxygenase [Gammaproteobacteria bacterium]|nr:putative 2OG-Fe(II) oxygenase [Gammaproteobacteria bacterium]